MAISYINIASNNGSTETTAALTLPASVNTGDLLIGTLLRTSQPGDLGGTVTWPSGWTQVDASSYQDPAGGFSVLNVYIRSATAGETLSGIVCSVGWYGWATTVAAYRGAVNTLVVADTFVGHGVTTSTSSPISTSTITNTRADVWRVCAFSASTASWANTWTTFTGSPSINGTLRVDVEGALTGNGSPALAITDTNGAVTAANQSQSATSNAAAGPWSRQAFIGLLIPQPSSPPRRFVQEALNRSYYW